MKVRTLQEARVFLASFQVIKALALLISCPHLAGVTFFQEFSYCFLDLFRACSGFYEEGSSLEDDAVKMLERQHNERKNQE